MSLDQNSIKSLQEQMAAIQLGKNIPQTFEPICALPDNFSIHSLEHYSEYRSRFKAKLETEHIASFLHYFQSNASDETPLFVSQDDMGASAMFDIGTVEQPQHGDHLVRLKLKKTAEMLAFEAVTGKTDFGRPARLNQREAAEWIEDWRDSITAIDGESEQIEIKRVIATIRNITIDAKATRESSHGDLSESQSILESIEARSKEGSIPTYLEFKCIPHHGLREHTFAFRLSISTDEKVGIKFTRIRPEKDQEEIAEGFVDLLRSEVGDNNQVLIGDYRL